MDSGDITDAMQQAMPQEELSPDRQEPTQDESLVESSKTLEKQESQVPKITIDTTPPAEMDSPKEGFESEEGSASKEEVSPQEFVDAYADPKSPMKPLPTPSNSETVEGFNLVQATGLTDTSAPIIPKSELPKHATPSPIGSPLSPTVPPMDRFGTPSLPLHRKSSLADVNDPLSETSKSKIFSQRMDYMINEFFSTVFQQKLKESLGQHWAHVTAQPEVDAAAKAIEDMYDYFLKMEKVLEKQRAALAHLTEVEAECSLYFQQLGFQEENETMRGPLTHLGLSYHQVCKEREPLITALDTFHSFIKNFRTKAIQDSLDTKQRQLYARQELDSYGSKLGQLEERKLKAFAKNSHAMPGNSKSSQIDFSNPMEKELELTRIRFHEAKAKYTTLSTQTIDKAGLLLLTKAYDCYYHVEKSPLEKSES